MLPSNSLRVLYRDELQDCLECLGIQGEGRESLGEKLPCTEMALASRTDGSVGGVPLTLAAEHRDTRKAVRQILCTSR